MRPKVERRTGSSEGWAYSMGESPWYRRANSSFLSSLAAPGRITETMAIRQSISAVPQRRLRVVIAGLSTWWTPRAPPWAIICQTAWSSQGASRSRSNRAGLKGMAWQASGLGASGSAETPKRATTPLDRRWTHASRKTERPAWPRMSIFTRPRFSTACISR